MKKTLWILTVVGSLLFVGCRDDGSGPTVSFGNSGSYTVVDSGQTSCYNNSEAIACPQEGEDFYGQDAQYYNASFAFQENGNGTVSDLNTGLTWQQGQDAMQRNWNGAQSYCDSLSLGDSSDWRLPSVKELYSIINLSTGWPYIDTAYFELELNPQESKNTQFWSSTFYEVGTTHGGQDTAFGVNFATGHIKGYGTGMPAYVRCVRGSIYGENSFVSNGDGTVTDDGTSLTWQQADDGTARDWEDALAYCSSLSLGGQTDWRLPNAKELQSIVDYSGNYPAINPLYFSIVDDDGYFWTSTSAYFSPASPGWYYGWYLAFGYAVNDSGEDTHGAGAVRFDTKYEGGPAAEDGERYYNYVRCVR